MKIDSCHDPNSPLLLGHLKETDTVQQGAQKSYLKGGITCVQQELKL